MKQELDLSPASVTVDCVSGCKSVPPDLGPQLYVKKQVDDFKVTPALTSNNSTFHEKKAPLALRKCSELAQD